MPDKHKHYLYGVPVYGKPDHLHFVVARERREAAAILAVVRSSGDLDVFDEMVDGYLDREWIELGEVSDPVGIVGLEIKR